MRHLSLQSTVFVYVAVGGYLANYLQIMTAVEWLLKGSFILRNLLEHSVLMHSHASHGPVIHYLLCNHPSGVCV